MHAPQPVAPAAVSLRRVTCRFGAVTAVDDVSLSLAQGELLTLLGPSGCGKTTTLRLVAGLEQASEGRIEIAGKDVTGLSAARRDVAMVFQSYALFPHMTVAENVGYGLRMSGMGERERRPRIDAALDLVGLAGFGRRMPFELSGGQQQRVALARAMVLEPKVLLFDEPLSNLDAKLRRRMRDEIRELQQRLRIAALYVTHDQEEALAISDRIVVMDRGRMVQEGSPGELYRRPATRFVADFIGGANIVEGRIVAVRHGRARVELGPVSFDIDSNDACAGAATFVIRPEAIEFAAAGSDGAFDATVQRVAYLGARFEVLLESPFGTVASTLPVRGDSLLVGERASFRLAPASITTLPGETLGITEV